MQQLVCMNCGSGKFRISHLRFGDYPKLLLLQRPVRCKVCDERTFVPIKDAAAYKRTPARAK